jgi:hypothetical protein
MPALTRRRIPNDHSEVWRIFYGDIPVGTIGIRSGVPVNVDQWGWSCGFSPGLNPGQHQDGSAASFDLARAAFEETWNALLPQILESAFDEYRRHRAFQSWKRRMWAEGKPLPTQVPGGGAECFCGAPVDLQTMSQHINDQHIEAT